MSLYNVCFFTYVGSGILLYDVLFRIMDLRSVIVRGVFDIMNFRSVIVRRVGHTWELRSINLQCVFHIL